MHANIYSYTYAGKQSRDSLSIIPEEITEVYVVNNYPDKNAPVGTYPVFVTDDKLGVRAFPAVWDNNEKIYKRDPHWLMYGGRLVCTSNSAGYNFRYPAKLMDRYES